MSYDSAISSFTTKTDKVDLVQAAHINAVQSELVAIETILGTNVKGNRTDLKTRINNALDADGSILSGTAYPSPALPSQLFYRTDLGGLYVYDEDWKIVGESLSNVIFEWHGCVVATDGSSGHGIIQTTGSVTPPLTSAPYATTHFYVVKGGTYRTILSSQFTKISGITTVTIHARVWSSSTNAAEEAILSVDIGGQANTVKSVTSDTPSWVTTSNIDVSSLTNGTTYTITIQLKNEANEYAYCSDVVLIAS
jgi:hypothetical protein